MPSQTAKAVSGAIGVVSAISSPTGYDYSFNVGASTAPIASAPQQVSNAGGPMTITEPQLQAKLEATEARLELKLVDRIKEIVDQIGAVGTRLTALEGANAGLQTKLDSKPGTWTVVGAIAGGVGAILAVLAFAGDRFDGGMSAAGALAGKQYEADQKAQTLNTKVDCLILKSGNPKAICK